MSTNAFQPSGNTVTIVAAVSPPTAVQVTALNGIGSNQYRVINAGPAVAFLGFSASAATALTNASNVSTSIPLLNGTDEILTFPPNMFVTAGIAANVATIYVTPGDGV